MLTLAAAINKNPTYSKQDLCILACCFRRWVLIMWSLWTCQQFTLSLMSKCICRWATSWGLWLRWVDPSVSEQETVVSSAGKTTQLGWDSHACGLLRGADERTASHSCWLHIWEADLDLCWLRASATSSLSCSRNHSLMIQAPLIRDATIRRRVHGVPKGAALYLLEWLLDLYLFPFSILETGWLCPHKKNLCYQHRMHVAVSHFAQAHVRLTFSFWSECFWILVQYCATYSFLSIYFILFFFYVQHGKRQSLSLTRCLDWNQGSSLSYFWGYLY